MTRPLRELIERVSVVPTNDGFEIELTGEITKMLAIPDDQASSISKHESSVKVVAGARNRLYLLVFAPNLPLAAHEGFVDPAF